ncbi:AAA family ATPase [Winogradskyella sp. SYSU M77433]|uniref:AAA family ATPase n=1 Tax=Winogradskyella sp. SYSU M77433 TaxID=3042722 RepID=UPI002481906D|nr:AAA family ATPase [Winogradskyella sp. SYSU M77433]MDH7913613.1 AAA family ATPase [Winogradskyella sp. SYSU M77433]
MDLLKGGAILGVIVGFWDKIKTFLWMILSSFIQKSEIKTEDVHNEVIGHLIKNYKYLKSYDKVFASQYESFRTGKYGLVAYEKFGDKMIIFLSEKKYFFKLFRVPFIFTKNSMPVGGSESKDGSEGNKSCSHIISLRGSVDVSKIIQKSTIQRNELSWNIEEEHERANRFNIYYFPERKGIQENNKKQYGYGYSWFRQNHYKILTTNQEDLGREIKNQRSALDNLFFPDNVKHLINLINVWVRSKEWYKEKHIPWKRGWLLYGVPGTGKTALARAFAEDLDLPIYFFSLAQMSNEELIESWQSMQLNVPCIALIEDIDNVFDKRKNIAQSPLLMQGHMLGQGNNLNGGKGEGNNLRTPLTFDTLLNCIDGVDKTDGVFTIITTNDISKIDDAIGQPNILEDGTQSFVSSRPGRIDRAIHLTYMTSENKIKMAENILFEFPDMLNKVYSHIKKNERETPAQFQEYCTQIALEEYWNIENDKQRKVLKKIS